MNVPTALKESCHWVLRKNKQPFNKEGRSNGWNEPSFWMSFQEAFDTWANNAEKFDGIGYVVARDIPSASEHIIGGDFDCCRDPITGEASESVLAALKKLNSPTEISPSGTGFRFFCKGKLPAGVNKVFGNLPDDLSDEAKKHIIEAKPTIRDKLSNGEPVWNGVEIYEHGPRHLTVTGSWLPDYPSEMENRTIYLTDIITPIIDSKKLIRPAKSKASRLPRLNITDVIDTTGFSVSGDELVGSHPVFGSTNGHNLHVNPSQGIWYCFHAGSECGGDAWLWLACECGAIKWEECGPGALCDKKTIDTIKRCAVERGFLTIDEAFPEEKKQRDAVALVTKLIAEALSDPGKPFEPENIEALAIVKEFVPSIYARAKTAWKGRIPLRDLERAIKEKSGELNKSKADSKYIKFDDEDGRMKLFVSELVNDIISDLNIKVVSGTRSTLTMYDKNTGVWVCDDSMPRKIDHESDLRVRTSGDTNVETLSNQVLSKIRCLVAARAEEVNNCFEQYSFLLCAKNGVIDLRTGELLPFRPEYYIAEHTATMYDDSKPWYEQAPTWATSLNEVFDGDQDRIEYFQRVMGYSITGETSNDSVYLLHGIGQTGKSTMIDTIVKTLDNSNETNGYAKPIKADLQNAKAASGAARDGLARAKYARMLFMKELDSKNSISWSTIKEIASTSNTMEVRKLYSGTEYIRLKAKLIIDTNHLPITDTPDNSILRRLKIIPFRHFFKDKKEGTFKQLLNEQVGILHWLVEGSIKYYKEGFGNPSFLEEELQRYKEDMDPQMLSVWFEQSGYQIEVSTDKLPSGEWIKSSDLYADYRNYVSSISGQVCVASTVKFSEYLKNIGATKKQTIRQVFDEDKSAMTNERSVFWMNLKKF